MKKSVLTFILLFGFCSVAQALTVILDKFADDALPIAIVPFGWQGHGKPPGDMASIISNDLHRSGQFKAMKRGDMPAKPTAPNDVRYMQWRSQGIENLVVGNIKAKTADRYEIRFFLFDVVRGEQLSAMTVIVHPRIFRKAAHQIADIVYEKLTGNKL